MSKGDIDDIWVRHFADSGKIFFIARPFLLSQKIRGSVCDIGSGAGFPGAVLAILMEEAGFKNTVTLIESNAKKCMFLEELRKSLNLSFNVHHLRAEDSRKKYDLITCRAVAPMHRLLPLINIIKKPYSKILLVKGKNWSDELLEIKNRWKFNMNVVKNKVSLDPSGGVTLEITNLRKIK